ncbi:MAG: GDSL-type esterase/lipase family protein [Acutalibacteraceae bacterium]
MKRILAMLAVVAVLLMTLATMPFTVSAAGIGDVDKNGYVNTADVRLLMRACVGAASLSEQQVFWGDCDYDGKISSTDARRLLTNVLENGETAIDFVNVTNTNYFGDRSITVIGDSISFGVGCGAGEAAGDIPNESYVGIIRNAINAKTGYTNYGFSSVRTQSWETDAAARSYGVNNWPTMSDSTLWETEVRSPNYLLGDGFTASAQWAYMDYTMRDGYNFDYFCIYYRVGADRGTFTVESVDDSGIGYAQTASYGSDGIGTRGPWFGCTSATEGTARTAFFKMSDFNNSKIRITVQSSGQDVTITGIGYYNDISENAITLNNFASPGLQLAGSDSSPQSGVSKEVLEVAAQAETLIFSLGYNDSHFDNNRDRFTARINELIEQVNKNGTKLIVNDMCWYIPSVTSITMDYDSIQWYKSELKRLAEETNSIYLNQQAIHGDAVISTIEDGAHPNATGHRLIAETILKAMGV